MAAVTAGADIQAMVNFAVTCLALGTGHLIDLSFQLLQIHRPDARAVLAGAESDLGHLTMV
ncbi:MAG: hypothetical protein WBV90_11450, partial [Terrimicrobiaceae bacterium]